MTCILFQTVWILLNITVAFFPVNKSKFILFEQYEFFIEYDFFLNQIVFPFLQIKIFFTDNINKIKIIDNLFIPSSKSVQRNQLYRLEFEKSQWGRYSMLLLLTNLKYFWRRLFKRSYGRQPLNIYLKNIIMAYDN